ncbi:MAG TPA: SRPBCC family protein [Pyrinomonadaceae bacterium]|jgi:ligand-binding SRPBCC domain-containing protein|nr:SRPBCC family protein [Pyrinomonadaceae bacterium]
MAARMRFVKESVIRASPERVFAFHEQSDVLTLLMPPWESARVIQAASISELGGQAIIETRIGGPIKTRWIAEHTRYEPPWLFEDVQVKGPFRSWCHRHIIEPNAEGAVLRDQIDYEPPLAFLGRALAPMIVQKRLQKLFDYRHEVTRHWCEGGGKWA